MRFSRRDALLRTVAVTAAGLIPGAAVPGLAAQPRPQIRDLSGRIRRAKHRCARKHVGRYGF